jgi:hypothetical protein
MDYQINSEEQNNEMVLEGIEITKTKKMLMNIQVKWIIRGI